MDGWVLVNIRGPFQLICHDVVILVTGQGDGGVLLSLLRNIYLSLIMHAL